MEIETGALVPSLPRREVEAQEPKLLVDERGAVYVEIEGMIFETGGWVLR